MARLTSKQIDEIAANVDRGMLCFYHIPSGKIISFSSMVTEINPEQSALFSKEELEERKQFDSIKKYLDQYLSFEEMSSRKRYDVMKAFAISISHKTIKESLLLSLKKKHPIRSFKETLFSLPEEVTKDWHVFKKQKGREWVEEQLELYDF